eukprot:Plantae.Rhodophyta-Purpureofilum_apyrenoidigerum.ctg31989.p2 GENE.Plantae.Rhodophyta-Purpureofilum_apyrenoidigerum.ctg31989~~Plantae.Rhodophyta-Purpureofilum_apyrenoidigerum.ctg31989.p2  ORF type:complete len:118 (+),score=12.44 Plantae.Rhodophyta-Purpureofilum_apyrenoidigerum.ctg31989:440-793(+)
MLLDRDRRSYHDYYLGSSVTGAWSASSIGFYVKEVLRGKRIAWPQEDPNQLGGDFLLDSTGTLKLCHPSQTSVDRVAIADVLKTVDPNISESELHRQSSADEVENVCFLPTPRPNCT